MENAKVQQHEIVVWPTGTVGRTPAALVSCAHTSIFSPFFENFEAHLPCSQKSNGWLSWVLEWTIS